MTSREDTAKREEEDRGWFKSSFDIPNREALNGMKIRFADELEANLLLHEISLAEISHVVPLVTNLINVGNTIESFYVLKTSENANTTHILAYNIACTKTLLGSIQLKYTITVIREHSVAARDLDPAKHAEA